MVAMRIRPTGTVKVTRTAGLAFLLSDDRALPVRVKTETKVPLAAQKEVAGNIRAGLRMGKLPYLVAEDIFTTTENAVIHDCIVHVGKDRFLVTGFYHPALPVNHALKDLASGFRWKGEIILFAIGKRVPYLSNVSRPKAREAVNQFMAGFLQHYHMNKGIPSGMVSPF